MIGPAAVVTWGAESLWLTVQVVLIGWVLVGWGYFVFRSIYGPAAPEAGPNPFEFCVPGLGALFAIAGVATLFMAFRPGLGAAVLVAGLVGYLWMLWDGRRAPGRLALHLVLTAVLGAYFAHGISITELHYDTGLYHLQQVLWYQAEPAPFGLVNLKGNYGYFSAWFPVTALLSSSRILPDALFLVNAALSTVVCGALLQFGVERVRQGRISFGPLLGLLSVVLLAYVANPVFFSWMGASPSTDIPAAWLVIYTLVRMATLLEDGPDLGKPDAEAAWGLLAAFTAASLATAVKLSQFPAALMVMFAGYWLWQRSSSRGWKILVVPGVSAAAVGVVWCLHGILTSGCVAFPSTASCIGALPWTIDAADLERFAREFRNWSRAPGHPNPAELTAWNWGPHWMELMYPYRPFLPGLGTVTLILFGGGLVWRLATPRKSIGIRITGLPWCVGASLLGVAVVAMQAPDPRYCLGFLVAFPAALLTWWMLKPAALLTRNGRTAWLAAVLIVTAGLGIREMGRRTATWPEEWGCCTWRSLPQVETKTVRTDAGAVIRQPTKGDQCWEVQGPCAPRPPADLAETRRFGHRVFERAE